jgi:hypothetical protein
MKLPQIHYASWVTRAATLLAFAATILIVVPFSPFIAGVEGEHWPYMMNAAVAAHLTFGRDVVFTAGPLTSIFTHAYHPATDVFMVGGLLLLATALFLGFLAITPASRRAWLLILPVLLSQFSFEAAMVMAIPLLWVMSAERGLSMPSWKRLAIVYVLGAACAVLTLVKGSMTIAVGVCAVLTFLSLWPRHRAHAFGLVAACVATLVGTWVLVGQPLSALPLYFSSQIPVVSGYTVAMALHGNTWEAFLFPVFAAILVWSIARGPLKRDWRAPLALMLLLFLVFKAGYVRHDMHATIAACAIAFAGLIAFLEKPVLTGKGVIGAVTGFVGCICLSASYQSYDANGMQQRLFAELNTSIHGLADRLFQPELLPKLFEEENIKVRAAEPLPAFKGDVDLYPENAAAVIASGAIWNPRPAITSYSAYTPSLAERDAEHLRTRGAARVYFDINPIDERYPSLEDGLSWPALLTSYAPSGFMRNYAVLERRPDSGGLTFGPNVSTREVLGGEVDLRNQKGPLWARINVTPTLAGRIASTLYKLPRLQISVTYADGSRRDYTFIPGMASAGFLLSPTVTSGLDFVALRSRKWEGMLGAKTPVMMRIHGGSGTRWLWQSEYDLTLQHLDIAADKNLDPMLLDDIAPGESLAGTPQGGTCQFDGINGKPAAAIVPIGDEALLEVRGWGVTSGPAGQSHDSLELVLSRDDRTLFVQTRTQARPDVGASFGHPDMANAGFFSRIDTTGMHGTYELRILQTVGGQRIVCPMSAQVQFR